MNSKRKNAGEKQKGKMGILKAAAKGTLVGVVVMLAVLMMVSGFVGAGMIPEKGMHICAAAAISIGAAVGALVTSGGVMCGIISGVMLVAICCVSGFLLYGNLNALSCFWYLVLCVVGGGVMGKLRGSNRRKHR